MNQILDMVGGKLTDTDIPPKELRRNSVRPSFSMESTGLLPHELSIYKKPAAKKRNTASLFEEEEYESALLQQFQQIQPQMGASAIRPADKRKTQSDKGPRFLAGEDAPLRRRERTSNFDRSSRRNSPQDHAIGIRPVPEAVANVDVTGLSSVAASILEMSVQTTGSAVAFKPRQPSVKQLPQPLKPMKSKSEDLRFTHRSGAQPKNWPRSLQPVRPNENLADIHSGEFGPSRVIGIDDVPTDPSIQKIKVKSLDELLEIMPAGTSAEAFGPFPNSKKRVSGIIYCNGCKAMFVSSAGPSFVLKKGDAPRFLLFKFSPLCKVHSSMKVNA